MLNDEELASIIADYLDGHTVLNLSTMGPVGPHAASVFYARVEFDLFWFSDKATRHSQDLGQGPECAGTITDNATDYTQIKGLQLHGKAEALSDPVDRQTGLDALVAKYDFLTGFMTGPGAARMENISIYRCQPDDITWIDNAISFGFKQTLYLS